MYKFLLLKIIFKIFDLLALIVFFAFIYIAAYIDYKEKKYYRNSSTVQDQKEYQRRYDTLFFEFEKTKSELEKVQSEIDDKKSRMTEAEIFFKNLAEIKRPVTEFDERTFNILVKKIVVSKDEIEVVWDDGDRI